jgi:phytanoyl-CoA hydroxylase
MSILSANQIDVFHQHGYLFLPEVIPGPLLGNLRREFARWIEESRQHAEPYGVTCDNRPRFDIEPGHSGEAPALRRIASPEEISSIYLDFVRDNRALDAVADIFGPNIRFENAKINSKQPGAATEVKFHQDFLFEPHSNDDMITVLYFLDDVIPENGPLEVVPGTHTGPLYDHWQNGVFTGCVDDDVVRMVQDRTQSCCGPAGSACLMHTRMLHGSAPNLSRTPRTLLIISYTAEDAHPLQYNHIPSRFMYEVVRGKDTGEVRCSNYVMKFPERPTGASFFDQQARNR